MKAVSSVITADESGTSVRPTVFFHSDLPSGEVTETAFHHVDLLPTIRATLGDEGDTDDVDGQKQPDAFENKPRPCFWRNQFLPDRLTGLDGELSY